MNRALLRLASLLVSSRERAEWLEEWRAELAYVPPKQATRFCLGAFRDACWMRRYTAARPVPLQSAGACVAVLTTAACLSLLFAFWLPLPRTIFFPRTSGLATISGITVEEYRQLPREHADFAFYLPRGPASRNFRAVAGADAARFLPGPFSRFDLVDDQSFPPDSFGYVVVRTDRFSERIGRFRLVPVAEPHPWLSFLLVLAMCLVVLPSVTEISLGKCPANARFWLFLAAKFVLIVPIVVLGSVDLFSLIAVGLQPHVILVGGVIGMRWVLVDQRRRCPVCLRLLSHPTSIGAPSRTLLEWYGTELMCDKGHGLMHVPEIRNSYSEPRWMRLDSSWSGLFCNPSQPRSIL